MRSEIKRISNVFKHFIGNVLFSVRKLQLIIVRSRKDIFDNGLVVRKEYRLRFVSKFHTKIVMFFFFVFHCLKEEQKNRFFSRSMFQFKILQGIILVLKKKEVMHVAFLLCIVFYVKSTRHLN